MERISTHQFMTLGAAVLMGTTFFPVATLVSEAAGRDGWMSVLPGFAVGVPYGLMVLSLAAKYPGQNLLQISELLFGKWIGKSIGSLYIFVAAYFGGLLLAQVGEIYQSSIMPQTPIMLFYIGGLLLVIVLVSSGVEVFARFSEVVFPIVVIALVLNLSLLIPRMEQGELLPILGEGLKPPFWALFKVFPYAMEYIFFLGGILPFLPTAKQEFSQLKKGVWRAVFLVGFLNTLVVLVQILVFGPAETVRLVYGLLVLGKMVEISRTVAGVESLFLGVMLGALVIKITTFFFATMWGLGTVFNLKNPKWIFATGVVFLGIPLGFARGDSLIVEMDFVDKYLILLFVGVWIPTLWAVSRWKKGTGVR